MTTVRDLGERGIVLRSLREGIDTANASGRMVAGVLASLAELELELGKERRTAARMRVAHAASSLGVPRRSTSRKWRWRSGCMRAVNRRDPDLEPMPLTLASSQVNGYLPGSRCSGGDLRDV
jgi:DNA invertase Pin-like site-specific DNA recombinase